MRFLTAYYLLLLCLTGCSPDQDQKGTYVLPYPVGQSYLMIQGNGGSFSHTGTFYYSFDFQMDIGTTVTAACEGTVIGIEESFTDGNRTPGQENYVIIRHHDGSFARYFHLTKNGALVEEGDAVIKGQQIGLSGDTGYSSLPHLHFDVTTRCALPAPNCQTKPISFINAADEVPQAGNRYEAMPYE